MFSNDEELSETLKAWNPMSESTMCPSSSATGIATKQHSSKKTSQQERIRDPYLVFRNAPESFTLEILLDLCSAYAKVLRGRKHSNYNMFFVNFATMNDVSNVFEGLKNNVFGFTVELGKLFTEQHDKSSQAVLPNTSSYHERPAIESLPKKYHTFNDDRQNMTTGNQNQSMGFFQNKPEAFETKIKIGPCEHCKKNCDMVCPRCMSFFCNEECQKAEWSRHRYVCGKPISMWPTWAKHLANQRNPTEPQSESKVESSPNEPQQDSSKKAALKAQLPASGNNVIVTAISKTNVVFVRSTLYEDNLKFFDTISKVQKEAKDQSSIQHTPGRGDIVFTKFKDDQYNRAMILNPDDLDKIKLIYIDYGNIDTKRLDDLYDAPEKFWNLPRMAVPIILKDVPEFTMTEEVKKYMFSYLNTDMKIVYDEDDFENGVNIAELFDLTGNESFNKTITTFTAGAIDQKKAPVVYREFLEHSRLPTGTNVELLVIDNSLLQTGFVSCTTEEYAQEIQNLQSDVQKYAQANKSKSSYTPRVNELCIAKYSEDNLWYRGRCIEVVGDGHPTILFIDYGNLCIVSVDDIMKYPEEFTFPIMTADCDIKGMPDKINEELKTKLEELLEPGTKLTCDSVEYFEEENIYSIYLKDLLKKVLP